MYEELLLPRDGAPGARRCAGRGDTSPAQASAQKHVVPLDQAPGVGAVGDLGPLETFGARCFCQKLGRDLAIEDDTVALVERVEVEVVPGPDGVASIEGGPRALGVAAGHGRASSPPASLREYGAQGCGGYRRVSHVV